MAMADSVKAPESFLRTLKVAHGFYAMFRQANNGRLEGGPSAEKIGEHLMNEYRNLGEPLKKQHLVELVKDLEVEMSRNATFAIREQAGSSASSGGER